MKVSTEETQTTISAETSEIIRIEPETEVVTKTSAEKEAEIPTGRIETGK